MRYSVGTSSGHALNMLRPAGISELALAAAVTVLVGLHPPWLAVRLQPDVPYERREKSPSGVLGKPSIETSVSKL